MTQMVLVVEDDKSLQQYLKDILLDNNYTVHVVSDGLTAMKYVKEVKPELVLLDLGLPNVSGETVCKEIRKTYPDLPIIMLTARQGAAEVVQGLSLGADDYITKPFVADELLARIKARLREIRSDVPTLKLADLEVNTQKVQVKRGGESISLTPHEFRLLVYLLQNNGVVLTREMILNKIWSYSLDVESRVVDVYMGYLRKKIDANHKKKLIHSIRGFGYTIKE
ncbi:MAG: response regulator transcription factor [Candidatus Levybacteria bacterium]|nr:response regulator transcription factor [Candidatus Levybacteria bacterium]